MKSRITLFAMVLCLCALMPLRVLFPQQQDARKDDSFKKAQRYFYERKFEMAELLLQETLKQNPENMLAYAYLGDIFLNKKNYDAALSLYKKGLDLDPSNAENYFRVGQIYYYKKIPNLAIENFQKSMEINKNIKFANYHIGLTYLMLLRDKDNTIKSWENYLRIAPEDPQYEKIRRVVELLRDPNFIIPPVDSDISIEEALHLGGAVLKNEDHDAKQQKAGHEQRKTKTNIEDVGRDDEM